MSMERRDFLRAIAAGGALPPVSFRPLMVQALFNGRQRRGPPEALGLFYDSTLCIGCKACVAGCKAANGMPVDISPDQREWNQGTWDTPKGLSGHTLNTILVYRDGAMEQKDREENGFAFIKRQCLHCVDRIVRLLLPGVGDDQGPGDGRGSQ